MSTTALIITAGKVSLAEHRGGVRHSGEGLFSPRVDQRSGA